MTSFLIHLLSLPKATAMTCPSLSLVMKRHSLLCRHTRIVREGAFAKGKPDVRSTTRTKIERHRPHSPPARDRRVRILFWDNESECEWEPSSSRVLVRRSTRAEVVCFKVRTRVMSIMPLTAIVRVAGRQEGDFMQGEPRGLVEDQPHHVVAHGYGSRGMDRRKLHNKPERTRRTGCDGYLFQDP